MNELAKILDTMANGGTREERVEAAEKVLDLIGMKGVDDEV